RAGALPPGDGHDPRDGDLRDLLPGDQWGYGGGYGAAGAGVGGLRAPSLWRLRVSRGERGGSGDAKEGWRVSLSALTVKKVVMARDYGPPRVFRSCFSFETRVIPRPCQMRTGWPAAAGHDTVV